MKSFALMTAFAYTALAHMEMENPPALKAKNNPNAGQDIDYSRTAPLASLSQYPCKGYHSLLGTPAGKATASYTPGQSTSITIGGGANHGGGSCQISLSFDKGQTFTVVKSVIGDCPRAGTSEIAFDVPADAPSGGALLAWTWSNKVGNREFYMDCASVQIAGSKKRSELVDRRDAIKSEKRATAFSARPALFIANLGNGCAVPEGTDVVYPNPGPDTERRTGNLQPPSPAGCGGAGIGSGISPPAASSAPPAAAPTTTKPAAAPPAASSSAGVPGGVFVTVQPGNDAPKPTSTPPAPTVSPPKPSPTADKPAPPAPTSTGSPAPNPGNGSTPPPSSGTAPGTACTNEGAWNCISGSSFQRCASGTWSAVVPMAAGTVCKAGVAANIEISASNKARRFRRARKADSAWVAV